MATAARIQPFDELLSDAIKNFEETFGKKPEVAACAPGRVNLIGEHIDYCDGFVLPMALPMVTIIVGRRNGTKDECNVKTLCPGADFPRKIQFTTDYLVRGLPRWANYVKGVIYNYGFPVTGFDAVIITNVPLGGGLSSSAALEVATMKFLELITNKKHEKESDKALICQKAEHTFAECPCGIMDQFISVMGKKNHALLIDCQSLTAEHIPFNASDLVVLICNSNVKHNLSESEYPTRRNQCTEALKLMGLSSYREVNSLHLEELEKSNADEVLKKRARHVIGEIERVKKATEALKKGNFEDFGRLMVESHKSLSSDFEVSCDELDKLVDIAMKCKGVLGSRMTGGGFGGCTVSLVKADEIDNVIKQIDAGYNGATFYVCKASDGARDIESEWTADMPLKFKSFYDISKTPAYQTTYIATVIDIYIISFINFAADSIFLVCCLNVGTYFDMLKQKVYETEKKELIKEHQETLEIAKELNDLFRPIIFFEFLIIPIVLCGIGVTFVMARNFVEKSLVIGYGNTMLIQLYFHCYSGEYLMKRTESVCDDLYKLDRDNCLVIKRTQKKIVIQAPFIRATLQQFGSVLNMIWSLITVLKSSIE
ncbi:hypothetical protein PVAND_010004 [Polypedilum vanderplanki]|uniref:Galactokinase n=1 Tax=Polypedilum vanderplanki TaxID=319348 RepID=A0A9J6CE92_POLVA|nr:hypothetical protein PVAND_010004 [Polypedilum vanderplanki]